MTFEERERKLQADPKWLQLQEEETAQLASITRRPHRALVAAAVLAAWLLLITTRQTALYRGNGGGPPGSELLPLAVVLAAMAIAVAARFGRPSVTTHLIGIASVVGGLALLAANLGVPFANASATYCGDFCRTAIMGRFVAFFGWPLLAALGLALAWRLERSGATDEAMRRAAWSKAWIFPTLIVGLLAALAWWRIVLP